MLEHSDILAVVMNIRNATLRKTILSKQDINYTNAAQILNKVNQNKNFNIGKLVFLKLEVAMELPERLFKIEQVIIRWEVLKASNIVYTEQVIHTSESELTWLILNDTIGVGNLCRIEKSQVKGDDEEHEEDADDYNEEPQAVTFLEVISFCAWPFSSF